MLQARPLHASGISVLEGCLKDAVEQDADPAELIVDNLSIIGMLLYLVPY